LPVFSHWLRDVLEDNTASTHVLVLDQLSGMLRFLLEQLMEKMGESRQSKIVSVEIGRLEKKKYTFFVKCSFKNTNIRRIDVNSNK
jgi:hypothetical protein